MAHRYNPRMRMPSLVESLRIRKEQLKSFPVGSTIEWKFVKGHMQVTGHDTDNGRVETAGGSYNPEELILIPK